MVYADSKQMLESLVQVSIPNNWDYNFVQSLHKNKPKAHSLSLAQYNKIVELFNKYVCVCQSSNRN